MRAEGTTGQGKPRIVRAVLVNGGGKDARLALQVNYLDKKGAEDAATVVGRLTEDGMRCLLVGLMSIGVIPEDHGGGLLPADPAGLLRADRMESRFDRRTHRVRLAFVDAAGVERLEPMGSKVRGELRSELLRLFRSVGAEVGNLGMVMHSSGRPCSGRNPVGDRVASLVGRNGDPKEATVHRGARGRRARGARHRGLVLAPAVARPDRAPRGEPQAHRETVGTLPVSRGCP